MFKAFMNEKNKNTKEEVCESELIVPLIPTTSLIIGPYVSSTMDLYKGKYLSAVLSVADNTRLVVIVDKIKDVVDITLSDVRPVGTLCDIKGVMRYTRDTTRVSMDGMSRVLIKEIVATEPIIMAKVEVINYDNISYNKEDYALYSLLKDKYYALAGILGKFDADRDNKLDTKLPDDGCDYILAYAPVSQDEFYNVMDEIDTKERLKLLLEYVDLALRAAKLEVDMETRLAESFAGEQRARYLREKREMIDRELNGDEDFEEKYHKGIESLPIDEEYKVRLEKELNRIDAMPLNSQEASLGMAYFDCILDLPWTKEVGTDFDLKTAEEILDEDHYGLEKVKERISEYLAVIKLTGSMKSPILCLAGPPGVGKTSIAKSIARATGRKYTRFALGGLHDEAEIRGHRKTYVGAMPGRIISGLRQVGTTNTVFLLDEIDKLSKDYKGDPASALLEVLDPEQNSTFTDNYVEIPFDLSNVLFITTANSLADIPEALLDRLEVIELDGYLPDEKLEIAKRHLVKKQMELNGVTEENIEFSDDVLSEIINNYTREAGVRQLERCIASLCRKAAKKALSDEGRLEVDKDKLRDYLGAQVNSYDIAEDESLVGVVNGLAWTSVGGCTLQIEAVCASGSGKLELTGQLGDVMKESAKAAIGYLRANSEKYGIDKNFWDEKDIHIHVPEGAVPKDGPSAGVTMATALYSIATDKEISQKLAMTGEITLTGRVLAIGGLREKLLAAVRAKIDRVIIPKQNEKDLVDVPEKYKELLKISFAERIDDVYEFVFGEKIC